VVDALFERKQEGGLKQLKRINLFFQKDFSDEEVFGTEEGNECELKGNVLLLGGVEGPRRPWKGLICQY
jgi:hypothetical protein